MTTIDMTYERRLEIAKMEAEEEKAQAARTAKEEGKIEGKIEGILDILSDYGEIPDDLRTRITKVEDAENFGNY